MKKVFVTMAAAALLASQGCGFLEDGMPKGRPFPKLPAEREEEETPGAAESADTSVYVCAVSVGGDYDWRRDTAYGIPESELLLLKNYETVLRIPCVAGSGVTPDPDHHFIIGGRLYSYGFSRGSTIICRDGEPAVRFGAREKICGLLPAGGALWTLGEDIDNDVLRLRVDGEEVWARSGATSWGGLTWTSYSRYGAFLEGYGDLVFLYREGGGFRLYRDGESTPVEEGRIAGYQARVNAYGDGRYRYYLSGRFIMLTVGERDGIRIEGARESPPADGPLYFFTPLCMDSLDGEVVLLLNYRERMRRAEVWDRGEIRETGVGNGYLSCVEICVSPPR